jgi:hypothetical protein
MARHIPFLPLAPREELEADWADEAEALGADQELMAWVRAVVRAIAERK